jgi:hypothetical protein
MSKGRPRDQTLEPVEVVEFSPRETQAAGFTPRADRTRRALAAVARERPVGQARTTP